MENDNKTTGILPAAGDETLALQKYRLLLPRAGDYFRKASRL